MGGFSDYDDEEQEEEEKERQKDEERLRKIKSAEHSARLAASSHPSQSSQIQQSAQ